MKALLFKAMCVVIMLFGVMNTSVHAQSCSQATSQGAAPAAWQTYCWLDFANYNDTTARSATGQNFSFTLSDASVLTFNVKTTPAAAPANIAITAPSWTGAAVGNTAFIGIPGKPILYQQAGGTTIFTFSNILITPPPGAPAVSAYAFVAADAESTNQGESLTFTTNGSPWTILDQVSPISGSAYPTISGTNTTTFTETGMEGTVGGYIVGSNSPTTVTTTLVGGGLQGAMFAVRFASLRLTKQITGARINAADQFTFRISATSSGSILGTGTTSGTTNGPFNAAAVSLASGIPLTLSEVMAAGSVSGLGLYSSKLTCINTATGSSTVVPTNASTTSYNFGALQFGDAIQCTFTNAAFPHIRVSKALGANGRRFVGDQFTVRINNGATLVATSTTTGAGTTVTGGDTGLVQVTSGTTYSVNELAAGTGSLAQYSAAMACTNGTNGVTTTFPTTVPGTITPVLGDVITCVITNTASASDATLVVGKTSTILSDGISVTNPKAIPGARVRYTITVSNTGNLPVDGNTIIIQDPFPANFTLDASTPMTMSLNNSGLSTFNQGTMVTYSSTGVAPYSIPLGTGLNAAIRGIRFQPGGTMAAATGTGPSSFSFTFVGIVN